MLAPFHLGDGLSRWVFLDGPLSHQGRTQWHREGFCLILCFRERGLSPYGCFPMPSSLVFLYGGTNEAKRKVVWLSRFLSENRHPQGCSTWPPSPPPPCPCSRRGQGIGKGPTGCVPMTPTPFTLHGGATEAESERDRQRGMCLSALFLLVL